MKNIKSRTHEKTQDLHLRVTKREKNKLSKEAEELGINMSAYMRSLVFGSKNENKPSSKAIRAVTMCQDIVTYVQEKYACEDDTELVERMDALWEIL